MGNDSMLVSGKEKFLTKEYVFVWLMYFGNVFTLYYYAGMITSIADGMGANAVLAGLCSTVYSISPIFVRNFAGILCDKWSRQKTNRIGILINVAMCAALIFCTNIILLIVVRAIMGIGFCLTSTANYAAASDVVPASRRAEGLGWFQNAASLSEYAGPALALIAITWTPGSYIGLHVGAILACIWALFWSFFVKYEKDPEYIKKMEQAKNAEKEDGDAKDIILPPKSKVIFGMEANAWGAAFIVLIITAAHSCTNTYALLSMQKRGLEDYASNFFLTMALGLFIGRAFISKLNDKYGALKVTIPVYIISAIAMIGIGTVDSGTTIVLLGLPYGLMFGTMASTSQALMVSSVMPSRRAYASSMYLLAMDLAFGFSSILWGSVIEIVGFKAIFAVAAICPLIACVVVAIYWKKVGHIIFDHIKATTAHAQNEAK